MTVSFVKYKAQHVKSIYTVQVDPSGDKQKLTNNNNVKATLQNISHKGNLDFFKCNRKNICEFQMENVRFLPVQASSFFIKYNSV